MLSSSLLKPFMEETDKKVIATGGVIRIANSCVIENGQITQLNIPDKLLPRFQVLEYMRSFLMARMAWSRLNGLLIISGALGMFDRDIVIKCGGYYDQSIGEDMELVVRMRRYMVSNNLKYSVHYIPDPLCWTECPTSYRTFERQRNRWTRGCIDTLFIHRKLFLNPKYGLMGWCHILFLVFLRMACAFGGSFRLLLFSNHCLSWIYQLAIFHPSLCFYLSLFSFHVSLCHIFRAGHLPPL